MTTIFTVTTLHFHDPDYGISPRTVGWYPTLVEAVETVRHNRGDIFETSYTYAVVTELPAGLYPLPVQEIWYEWSDIIGGYRPCERPEEWARQGIVTVAEIG